MPADHTRAFGQHVRRLRTARDMTLVELGAACGLAPSTLSKVENGHISLTYDNLIRLADGLAVDLARLIDPQAAARTPNGLARCTVTRAAERPKLPAGIYAYEPLAAGLTRKIMDPTIVRVHARAREDFYKLVSHSGEEFIFVLSGEIELHTEHYAPIRLAAGDSIYFDATMGHVYVSVSEEDATILNICAGAHGEGSILAAVEDARSGGAKNKPNGGGTA